MKPSFAFIVHSRGRDDLPRKFPFLKLLPNFLFDALTLSLPPIVVSQITGLKSESGEEKKGLVIGIPMTATQLLENRELATKKITKAVQKAKAMGATYIGLGAMTASLTRGGKHIIENVDGVYVTTGRTYTVKNIVEYVNYCTERFNLNKEKIKIAIVGAAGSIGSGVAITLARNGYKKFYLVDLERKLDRLAKYITQIEKHVERSNIVISHQIPIIQECNIIIAATSSPEAVITSNDVSPGTIIINDAQPSDISPDIIKNRRDTLVIEGGVLHTSSINCHFNFGLAQKNDIFSCLAETLWLTYKSAKKHHSIDDFDFDMYERLNSEAKDLQFDISTPQNSEGLINNINFMDFSKIITNRN